MTAVTFRWKAEPFLNKTNIRHSKVWGTDCGGISHLLLLNLRGEKFCFACGDRNLLFSFIGCLALQSITFAMHVLAQPDSTSSEHQLITAQAPNLVLQRSVGSRAI